MFAALYVPSSDGPVRAVLMGLARSFSPRIELHGERLVVLDVSGLKRMFGEPAALGESVSRAASERGWSIQVAIAATRTAALLMAIGRSGLTVVPPGSEAAMLAALPLDALKTLAQEQASEFAKPRVSNRSSLAPSASSLALPAFVLLGTVQRWGLKTLGDLAALPPADLFERLGAGGLDVRRLARGEDERPLVPDPVEERFETALALEWPIETLEPLAFVLSRVLDPLCARLEQRGMAAAALHVQLTLVPRESYVRTLQLPMPLRDARVLRTLILLDLESHPFSAGIDRITVAIDPVPARTVQFSLLDRARPTAAALSTLLARLDALMGEGRCGRPELVDAHRPDAFEMRTFGPGIGDRGPGARVGFITSLAGPVAGQPHRCSGRSALVTGDGPAARRGAPSGATRERGNETGFGDEPSLAPALLPLLRRFRHPVPARVGLEHGRPVRVATGYQPSGGGRVVARAGPWRSSGEWWKEPGARRLALGAREDGVDVEEKLRVSDRTRPHEPGTWNQEPRTGNILDPSLAPSAQRLAPSAWDHEEWDVALSDGGIYRIFRDRRRERWFVEGIID